MSTKTKTLAKSLHTVTVLVTVARLIAKQTGRNPAACVGSAAVALGYSGQTDANASDPYGLRDRAREILAAE